MSEPCSAVLILRGTLKQLQEANPGLAFTLEEGPTGGSIILEAEKRFLMYSTVAGNDHTVVYCGRGNSYPVVPDKVTCAEPMLERAT